MPDFGVCEHNDRRRRIPLAEKRCNMFFINPKGLKVRRILVDGCAITDGPRCDWLIITRDAVEHYVELKASDVKHALAQIEETIKRISADARCCHKRAFIISLRCPLAGTDLQNKQKYFKKEYNTVLRVRKPNFEFEI